MQTLIKNATIVTSERIYTSDIWIREGKIHKICLSVDSSLKPDQIIDATDFLIFPGGIDPHVHLKLKTAAGYSVDDFVSGSRAALFGGTTTIIDFVTPKRGQSLIEALNERLLESKNSLIDYSFHISPVEWRDTTEAEIKECVRLGFPSFKIYMAYKNTIGISDEVILKVMMAVAKAGGMVTAHCEMDEEIQFLRDSYVDQGKTSPLFHALSRPPYAESEAVGRAIELAIKADCPLYIVHVSSEKSICLIRDAQIKGARVFAETCPQYTLLDDRVYLNDFEQASAFVMSPPLRKETDQKALWEALADGTIQTIGTDHCPFLLAQKSLGEHDFRFIPNGAGGVEHRLSLIYTYGVQQGKLSLSRFVELMAFNPATIFGLYPRKGQIIEGSDADIVFWRSTKCHTISKSTHHSLADSNIYEGFKTEGEPEMVMVNGDLVIENQRLLMAPQGQLLRRFVEKQTE